MYAAIKSRLPHLHSKPKMSSNTVDAAHLTALVDVLSSAVKEVIAEYSAAGEEIPSLDSTKPGPFDTPEATSHKLNKAIQIIEGACAQLSASVARPGHTVTNVSPDQSNSSVEDSH